MSENEGNNLFAAGMLRSARAEAPVGMPEVPGTATDADAAGQGRTSHNRLGKRAKSPMEYRREIDGLRAVAVIPVILFHAGLQVFSGGFVGVDIFFVISGYLITSIILADLEAGRFSTINFYERRARRILPALFLVMLVCLPLAWFWLLPEDMLRFSQSLVAVSLFGSNILFWQSSNYFDIAAELKPLLHTWSLAVEEQYYVFFPLLLALTWKLGKRFVVVFFSIGLALSLAAAQWASGAHPEAAFFLLPTRGWELLIGALAAIYLSKAEFGSLATRSRVMAELGGIAGISMLAYAIFWFDRQTPFPSLYALVPTLGAALIILCADGTTVAGRLLGSRPLVGVGLISYSAYLWHQPLLAFARHRGTGQPGSNLLLTIVAASIALAYLSWKYVETPFRHRERFSRKQIFAFGAGGSLLFISFGLLGQITSGYQERMPKSVNIPETELARIDNGWCFYSVDTIDSLSLGEKGLDCWLGDRGAGQKGLLFGDSFAGQYEPMWDTVGRDSGVAIHAVTTNWCYPSVTQDFTGSRSRSRALKQCLYNKKYVLDNLEKYDFVVLGGEWGDISEKGKLDNVLELIKLASARSKFVVLMPSPRIYDMNPLLLYRESLLHHERFDISSIPTTRDQAASKADALLQQQAQKFGNVLFIGRNALFNVDGSPSDVDRDGVPFSWDGSHISIRGSKEAAASFLQSKEWQDYLQLLHGNPTDNRTVP